MAASSSLVTRSINALRARCCGVSLSDSSGIRPSLESGASGQSSLHVTVGPDTREGCHYMSASQISLDLLQGFRFKINGARERPPWLLYLIQRRGAILELHSIILNVVSRYTCALNISYRIAEFWLVNKSAYSTLSACSDVGRSCYNYGYFRQ